MPNRFPLMMDSSERLGSGTTVASVSAVRRNRVGLATGLVALLLVGACGDGPTDPGPSSLTLEMRAGDGQIALVGTTLSEPLSVVVRDRRSGDSVPQVSMRWEIVQGSGASLRDVATVTDSLGRSSNRLTVGSQPDTYRVRVSLSGLATTPLEFSAIAARTPRVTAVPASTVAAGETITIQGTDFHPDASQNVVEFAGIRQPAITASPTQLTVRVPVCLPTRTVSVRVRFGPLRSDPVSLSVAGSAETLSLSPGAALVSADPKLLECVRLPRISGSQYLIVTQATSTHGGGRYPYRIVGVAAAASAAAVSEAQPAVSAAQAVQATPVEVQDRFEAQLRNRERELAAVAPHVAAAARVAVAEPEVGDRKTFSVINKAGMFERVTAEVRFVSRRAVLYQDLEAPAGGFTESDFRQFAQLFDDPIYETDVAVYGEPSDLDGNGRINILFTPVVNALTARGTDGFIAGFFFGNDLLDGTGTNRAEVFYSLVPDPEGKFSDIRTKGRILRTVPAVLAHEFQHMIHFNQRFLMRKSAGAEALWLSEGLAHMAEDLVAQVFIQRRDSVRADDFELGNILRGGRFLAETAGTSLLSSLSPGTLEERGAAWLFVKYLLGHFGGNQLLGRLTQTTRTSTANVTAETGRTWPSLLADWGPALFLDDLAVPVERRFTFPDYALRATLGRFSTFPLQPRSLSYQDFTQADTLASSSSGFLLVRPGFTTADGLYLSHGHQVAGPIAASANPQIIVVRLR